MKKYDLLLVGLYMLPVLVFVVTAFVFFKMGEHRQKETLDYVMRLYQTPINTVEIRDTGGKLKVIRDSAHQFDFRAKVEFQGSLYNDAMGSAIRVSGDTLKIGDFNYFGKSVTLYVGEEVKVDTINCTEVELIHIPVQKDTIQDGL